MICLHISSRRIGFLGRVATKVKTTRSSKCAESADVPSHFTGRKCSCLRCGRRRPDLSTRHATRPALMNHEAQLKQKATTAHVPSSYLIATQYSLYEPTYAHIWQRPAPRQEIIEINADRDPSSTDSRRRLGHCSTTGLLQSLFNVSTTTHNVQEMHGSSASSVTQRRRTLWTYYLAKIHLRETLGITSHDANVAPSSSNYC